MKVFFCGSSIRFFVPEIGSHGGDGESVGLAQGYSVVTLLHRKPAQLSALRWHRWCHPWCCSVVKPPTKPFICGISHRFSSTKLTIFFPSNSNKKCWKKAMGAGQFGRLCDCSVVGWLNTNIAKTPPGQLCILHILRIETKSFADVMSTSFDRPSRVLEWCMPPPSPLNRSFAWWTLHKLSSLFFPVLLHEPRGETLKLQHNEID